MSNRMRKLKSVVWLANRQIELGRVTGWRLWAGRIVLQLSSWLIRRYDK